MPGSRPSRYRTSAELRAEINANPYNSAAGGLKSVAMATGVAGKPVNAGVPRSNRFVATLRRRRRQRPLHKHPGGLPTAFQADRLGFKEFCSRSFAAPGSELLVPGVHTTAAGIEHSVEVVQDRQQFAGMFVVNGPDILGPGVLVGDESRIERLVRRLWERRLEIPFQALYERC